MGGGWQPSLELRVEAGQPSSHRSPYLEIADLIKLNTLDALEHDPRVIVIRPSDRHIADGRAKRVASEDGLIDLDLSEGVVQELGFRAQCDPRKSAPA